MFKMIVNFIDILGLKTLIMQQSIMCLSFKMIEKKHFRHFTLQFTLLARISLSLFTHPSLSSIAPGRSSKLHSLSVQSCCRQVLVGRQILARPCEGVHRKKSLTSSSLLLQQCLTCLVCLTWMLLEIGSKWQYICCFVMCCFPDLFNIAHSSSRRAIFLCVLSASMLCIHRKVLT